MVQRVNLKEGVRTDGPALIPKPSYLDLECCI